MKQYVEMIDVDISAQTAWQALQNMHKWLPLLSTNQKIDYENGDNFLVDGRKYTITTTEGILMRCQIKHINQEKYSVELYAEHKPLVSHLTCTIIPLDNEHCRLIRTQRYPGIIGFLFTHFFNKREANETSEYLTVWSNYAKQLLDKNN